MRIAVLGAGRIGSFRARVLSELPAVNEVIIGNRTVERAQKLAREVGGRAGTIEEAIDSEPDAVFNPRGHDFRLEVFGSEDSLSVGQNSLSQPRSVEPGTPSPSMGPYRDFIERFGESLRQETIAFIEVMKGERENPSSPPAAMEALRVAVACEVSRKEGRPVRVAEIEHEPSNLS
jgi:predicted dehydrogenase